MHILANLLLVLVFMPVPLWAQNPPPGFQLHAAPKPVGDIRFLDAQGKTHSLSMFKGRAVLINLWSTWCPPCREEMPSLDQLQKLLGPSGLVILPVSLDVNGPRLVPAFYREHGIQNLPMLFDPKMSIISSLKIRGVPASLLISPDGWEIGRLEGSYNWTDKAMVAFLRKVLISGRI